MRQVIFLMVLVVCSSLVLGDVLINEVMYAPTDGNEWVEIYNNGNGSVDLTNWQISDNLNTDEISCCGFVSNCSLILGGNNYALITDQDTSLYNNLSTGALKICVDDNSIGNGLANSGDVITLFNGNESDSLNYDGSLGKNGKTLEKNKDDEWKESIVMGGTPGEKNSVYDFNYDFSVLEITEIMANPLGDDGALKPLGEWVEIYNSGQDPVYLEGLVLYDEYDNHKLAITDTNTLKGLVLCNKCYTVVYRDGDNDFELSGTTEDKVRLFYGNSQGTLFDEVVFAGAVEGMSWSKINGEWYKTKPSPGEENVYTADCDWEIEVFPRESIFNLGQDVGFDVIIKRNYGEPEVLSVEGQIENVFGEIVKKYRPWTNESVTTTRTKTYSPNLKEEVYKIIFEIKGLSCQDNNLNNNVDSRIVVVNPKYKIFDSSLKIEKVYLGSDDKAGWGDRVRVKVSIYKGDETKYNVELYVEKEGEIVSKRTKTSVFDKFTNYSLTLPVQLEPNCDHDYQDDDYELVLKGLEREDRETIEIEGVDSELCKTIDGSSSGGKGKLSYKILEKPEKVEAGEDFKVKVELVGDKEDHEIKITGFVYRGPKHYSGDSVKEIKLKANEINVLDLWIELDEKMEEGEYKVKVKINKDNQKTDKEIVEVIRVEEKKSEVSEIVSLELSEGHKNFSIQEKLKLLREVKSDGKIVYLSSSYQAKKFLVFLIVGVFGLLSLILIFKKV